MRRLFLLLLFACAFGALAQTKPAPKLEPLPEPPPPPPGVQESPGGPAVRIPVQEGDKVEAFRQGGRVVLVRVTPKDGPVYYLMDPTGAGNWTRRDSLDDGVRVPMWPLKVFD